MIIKESELRKQIRSVLKEFSIKKRIKQPIPLNLMTTAIGDTEVNRVSNGSNVQDIMLSKIEFLVKSIKHAQIPEDKIKFICNELINNCDNDFDNVNTSNEFLRGWKKEISPLYKNIQDKEFKEHFCAAVAANCEMIKNNYQKLKNINY